MIFYRKGKKWNDKFGVFIAVRNLLVEGGRICGFGLVTEEKDKEILRWRKEKMFCKFLKICEKRNVMGKKNNFIKKEKKMIMDCLRGRKL